MLKEPGLAKHIAMNAPKKYRRIVEPFADSGIFALYPGKKKPKEHLVNIADEMKFNLAGFIQGLSGADKKRLKGFDWTGSPEAFDAALAISAMEGPEMFYRAAYLMEFGIKDKDPEQPPSFDHLKAGHDMSGMLYGLPALKVGIKGATLSNEDPMSVLSSASGSDTFVVLLPKTPEEVEAVEARLPLSSPFFFAKKSKGNEELFDSAAKNAGSMNVSYLSSASIMVSTFEVRTNYDSGLTPLEPLKE